MVFTLTILTQWILSTQWQVERYYVLLQVGHIKVTTNNRNVT